MGASGIGWSGAAMNCRSRMRFLWSRICRLQSREKSTGTRREGGGACSGGAVCSQKTIAETQPALRVFVIEVQ